MDKNLGIVAEELFGKIRTQFPKIKIGDKDSKVTDKPKLARFFDFDYVQDGKNLGRVSVSLSEDDGLVVIFSNDIVEQQGNYTKKRFYRFLKELREFAKQKLMNFDTRDISKSNLDKRDYKQLSNNIGESQMTESKLYGTSMTSYQQLGDTKLIVKHSSPVNAELPAGRTQRIESIYVENAQGERFRYPYRHLNGARALAQHVAHGGTPYDTIGQHVIGLSEEMSKLRMFKHYVDRNPTISENVGAIQTKVVERIEEVKKQIFDLQNSAKYESFAESFEDKEEMQIPEEIMNDWIDRLTIRSFNEELKNVFPYIFKLVSEEDIPVKDLTVEDLIGEAKCETCGMDPCDCDHSETKEDREVQAYEAELDKIIGETADIFSTDEAVQAEAVEKLNQLIANPFPVGTDGTNAVESLSGIIEDDELMDIFKELADVNPNADAKDILKDYIQMKDEEKGTDVLSKISFEADASAPAAAPEEPAAAEQPVAAEEKDTDPPFDGPYTTTGDKKDKFGNTIKTKNMAKHLAKKGMAKAIEKAKKAGATAETVVRIAGKEMTLGEVITKAGLQVEDVFGDRQKSAQGELIEFVKSMYDQNTGNFPKGETGVLIAVEKKFGEGAVSVAQKVIGKLQNMYESRRIMKLAGLAK